ncbi:alpha/beta hydrolase [Bacillus thuringiensis serovar roskildiensis]|uniref:Alpha/beta hydrolase n=1 Tax=Bacillus thuringiensis serovar sooncheon TaxID=180891 RepID=A0A9Q5SNB4_BACTU|nr:alpha/beta family hydrolase [Bacillus thuringiensis]OTW71925.1 alpha/beta hydrolase [Bacillus thuringiensis serovar coreanensis]OTX55545.1 alpha/beta hydrolase [Bacillus thuringiensis serovar sooncheon]OTX58882.1 alpha/beta hydrolase [Bacillus thuringiensis serovar guiyangiensis]OTX72485.1 alpha/beta hydrolase [Bacillus thuringiensis serovar roskildiensis]
MKGTKKEIHIDGKVIPYTHIEKGSNRICFMFSGSGYNYDKPLFYYATMLMLEHKIDVVHIHYSYDEQVMNKPIEEVTKIMMDDINPVIKEVLKGEQYNDIIFLGKSLGTIPIANDLMKREEYLQSNMILFTPLLTFDPSFDSILHSDHEGLLVIGDKDHQYNADQIDQLHKTNLQIEVVKNANHSVNVGEFETEDSIEAIANIMRKLEETVGSIRV